MKAGSTPPDLLGHLARRAAAAVAPAVRPRLASRFEPMSPVDAVGDDIAQVHRGWPSASAAAIASAQAEAAGAEGAQAQAGALARPAGSGAVEPAPAVVGDARARADSLARAALRRQAADTNLPAVSLQPLGTAATALGADAWQASQTSQTPQNPQTPQTPQTPQAPTLAPAARKTISPAQGVAHEAASDTRPDTPAALRLRIETLAPLAPPVLPLQPAADSSAPAPRMHWPRSGVPATAGAAAATTPTPPAIEITIGRIEIRGAAAEPEAARPAPRTAASAPTSTLSLADYLQRREGRR